MPSTGAVDAEQSPGERLGRSKSCVDSRLRADEVRIKRTDDDAGVVGAIVVEANEVLPIEREQNSIFRGGEREHLVIWDGPAGVSRVDDGQDVIAQSAYFLDDREREGLVGVESRHGSGGLVLIDLADHLILMGTRVSPGVHEILGP